jgi:hypothetical protein
MNNFAELSDGAGAQFLVRWRGRQEGPYPAAVIEVKLAANEIGLLHEIFYNGKWVTIRDYVAERETVLRAENQAREDQEKRMRQAAEQEAREQEEHRQAEILAEERRRSEQIAAAKSRQMTEDNSRQPTQANQTSSSGLQTLGAVLLIAGIALAAYFFLAFDASVESGYGRVNNIGLMADRQNGIIIGIGLGVAGTIMLAIGSRNKN